MVDDNRKMVSMFSDFFASVLTIENVSKIIKFDNPTIILNINSHLTDIKVLIPI